MKVQYCRHAGQRYSPDITERRDCALKNRSSDTFPRLAVLASALLFSTGGLFFKIIPWDALAIGSARSILAGTAILIWLLIRKHKFRINRTVLIAAAAISITNTLYALANKLTTAGNTIVLQFTMPVFVILIMLCFFHRKPSVLEIGTCVITLLGIVLFFVDSLSAGNMLGNLLAVLSGMAYAVFFVWNSREDSEPYTTILISYVIAALIGLPSLLRTDIAGASSGTLLSVLGLGLLQQAAGHILFAVGIKRTPAVTASLISGIEPILNPILVAVFYHEMLTPLSLFAAGLVLSAVLFYNIRTAKSAAA